MPDESSTIKRFAERRLEAEFAGYHRLMNTFRSRVLGGLLLLLPIVITFWIIASLYSALYDYLLAPLILVVHWLYRGTMLDAIKDTWFGRYVAPLIAIFFALTILYFLGMLVRSRLHRLIDWIFLHLPIVTTVYGAVRNVFLSLDQQSSLAQSRRAVLVAFPQPGMRVPAFVTSSCRDHSTGKTILCVYVPTTPVPTSGYMLLVPEEETTPLDWNLDETLTAIVSGGITAPPGVGYFSPQAPAGEMDPNGVG